ncbi:hypothetical protein DIPPA_24791 [Diplonema papillatum]|nr:hypothetical protein DIPPA_24791 [Diplonema papillatum]
MASPGEPWPQLAGGGRALFAGAEKFMKWVETAVADASCTLSELAAEDESASDGASCDAPPAPARCRRKQPAGAGAAPLASGGAAPAAPPSTSSSTATPPIQAYAHQICSKIQHALADLDPPADPAVARTESKPRTSTSTAERAVQQPGEGGAPPAPKPQPQPLNLFEGSVASLKKNLADFLTDLAQRADHDLAAAPAAAGPPAKGQPAQRQPPPPQQQKQQPPPPEAAAAAAVAKPAPVLAFLYDTFLSPDPQPPPPARAAAAAVRKPAKPAGTSIPSLPQTPVSRSSTPQQQQQQQGAAAQGSPADRCGSVRSVSEVSERLPGTPGLLGLNNSLMEDDEEALDMGLGFDEKQDVISLSTTPGPSPVDELAKDTAAGGADAEADLDSNLPIVYSLAWHCYGGSVAVCSSLASAEEAAAALLVTPVPAVLRAAEAEIARRIQSQPPTVEIDDPPPTPGDNLQRNALASVITGWVSKLEGLSGTPPAPQDTLPHITRLGRAAHSALGSISSAAARDTAQLVVRVGKRTDFKKLDVRGLSFRAGDGPVPAADAAARLHADHRQAVAHVATTALQLLKAAERHAIVQLDCQADLLAAREAVAEHCASLHIAVQHALRNIGTCYVSLAPVLRMRLVSAG